MIYSNMYRICLGKCQILADNLACIELAQIKVNWCWVFFFKIKFLDTTESYNNQGLARIKFNPRRRSYIKRAQRLYELSLTSQLTDEGISSPLWKEWITGSKGANVKSLKYSAAQTDTPSLYASQVLKIFFHLLNIFYPVWITKY